MKGKELWCRDSSGVALSGVRGGMLRFFRCEEQKSQQVTEEPGLGKEGTSVSVPLQ